MGQIHVDDMTLEILCTDLCDFRAKSVGAVSKNVFCKNWPHGGARRRQCEKAGLEVAICHPRSVCAKFGIDRGNGCGDKGRAKSVGQTHRRTDGQTDRQPMEVSLVTCDLTVAITV